MTPAIRRKVCSQSVICLVTHTLVESSPPGMLLLMYMDGCMDASVAEMWSGPRVHKSKGYDTPLMTVMPKNDFWHNDA